MSFLVSTSHNSISHKHGACFSSFTGNPFLWVSLLIFLHSCLELLPMNSNTTIPRRTEVPKAEKARETAKIQKIWKIRRSTRSSHEVLKTLYLFGRCLYHSTWAEVRGQLEGIGSLLPPHHTGLEDSILVFRLRSTSLTPWAISLTCFHEMENAVGSCRRVPTLAELHTAGHRLLGVQVCESSLTPGRAFQWHRSLLVTHCVYKKPQ